MEQASLEHFLACLRAGDVGDDDFAELLPRVSTELDPLRGPSARLYAHAQRQHTVTSMLSVIWLLHDRYDLFTQS